MEDTDINILKNKTIIDISKGEDHSKDSQYLLLKMSDNTIYRIEAVSSNSWGAISVEEVPE